MTGKVPVDLQPIALSQRVGHFIGLFVQAAGVDGKDSQLQAGLVSDIDDNHVLQREGAGQRDRPSGCFDAGTENIRRCGTCCYFGDVVLHANLLNLIIFHENSDLPRPNENRLPLLQAKVPVDIPGQLRFEELVTAFHGQGYSH